MNNSENRKTVLPALLCAGLFFLGCKDLFYPEGSAGPAETNYAFNGWNTNTDGTGTPDSVWDLSASAAGIALHAQWISDLPAGLSLSDTLAWINANAVEDGAYSITLIRDETIEPATLFCGGKNVSVTLRGGAAKRTVTLSSGGSLFTVDSGITLTLDDNIALRGRDDNTASLINVNSGGALAMNTGAAISGNTGAASGGGVYVDGGGTFAMSGGEISGNTAISGGGVYVDGGGMFAMSGGKISRNTSFYGGGADVSGGTFVMSGGEISGNTSFYGGGVDVSGGAFTMSGGTISGNTGSYGGGVYSGGAFVMSGGEIGGNTAFYGGGVDVSGGGAFAKQPGGTIYGSDAGARLKNTAGNDGHAVYVDASAVKKRNTTAGLGVALDSAKTVSEGGGWE
jgi:hypothetical protein